MRRMNYCAFDEFIPAGSTSSAPVYTPAHFNDVLGKHNQLGVHVIVDNVTGTGTFDLWVDYSSDGLNWNAQNTHTSYATGAGNVSLTGPLATTGVNQGFFSLAFEGTSVKVTTGDGPLLGQVRLRMQFSNGTTSAHVAVHVTQRDT